MASRVISSLYRWVSACPALGPLCGSVTVQGWDGGLEPHRCSADPQLGCLCLGLWLAEPHALSFHPLLHPAGLPLLLLQNGLALGTGWPRPARPHPTLRVPTLPSSAHLCPTQLHVSRPTQPCPSALPRPTQLHLVQRHPTGPAESSSVQLSPAPPHSALLGSTQPCPLSPPLPSPTLPFRPPVPHPTQLPSACSSLLCPTGQSCSQTALSAQPPGA